MGFTLCFSFLLPADAANYYSRTSGKWGTSSTWSTVGCGGAAAITSPGAGDNVTICAGDIVLMDGNSGACLSLTIKGTADWTQARTTNVGAGGLLLDGGSINPTGTKTGTLNVTGPFTTANTNTIAQVNLTITGNTTISSIVNITSSTGTKTFTDITLTGTLNNSVNTNITINGNFQNTGTFNFGTGRVIFGGATSNVVTGNSTTFNAITVDKGTSSVSVIDFQAPIVLTAGGLTLTNGTFKLTNASSIEPFTVDIITAPYLIPSTCALWCNGGTINAGNMNWTVAGELRVSAGTVNLGNTASRCFLAENNNTAKLTMEGGILNVAGRISRVTAGGDNLIFNMSGGTINVPAVGSPTAGFPPFLMDVAGSSFTMSAGTINILREGGNGTEKLGFYLRNVGTVSITGGTIQIGDASTPASQTIGVNTTFNIAKLLVNSANATCFLQNDLTVLQSVTINSGTLNANNLNLTVGGLWTNSGAFIPGTGTVTFNGTGTQNITKSGGETFNNFTVNKTSGTVVLVNNVQVNTTLSMPVTNAGNIDCGANTLTLGISTVSSGTLSYTAGTIIGKFKRWKASGAGSLLFPTGTSSYYRSVLTTFTSAVGGTLMSNFVSSNPGSNGLPYLDNDLITTIQNQYTEGYWDMTAADGFSSTNYAVECTGNGFTSYSVGASTRLMYRAIAANSWSVTINGAHVNAVGNTAKRTGVSGATGQFAFGKPACSAYLATSIGGDTGPCISTVKSYTVNASNPANTYSWSITPPVAGSVTGGQTTPTVTITWGGTGQQATVQVVEKNDCGDNNPSPPILAVTLHPIATSTITGSASVSTNEAATYSVTLTPGYTYSWSLPGGGGSIGGQGTNTTTITWGTTPGTYTVQIAATRICGAPDVQTYTVTVRGPLYSTANGFWDQSSTWSTVCGGAGGSGVPGPNDEVVICAANTVTMKGNPGSCRKLTIYGTAHWTQGRTTDVGTGGIIIDNSGGGSGITGTNPGILTSAGGLTLNSNANFSSPVTIVLQTNSQNIVTNASAGSLNLLDIATSSITVTNTGTLTVTGTLSGAGNLTQSNNSILNMNGTTFTLATLNATASGNTVNYGANSTQTVVAATYNHLAVSGTGTKILGGATTVNKNLTISSASTVLDVDAGNNYALTVGGNWTNSGTFNEQFGTVTFSGASTQTITAAGGETFNNLNMTGSGAKNLSSATTINFDFTLSSTLNTNNNDISIRGNFDNSGTYNGGSNNVTFNNNTKVLGASPTTFNNVVINAALTGHASNMNVTGDWTNNGSFIHNSGTVTLNGGGAQSIGGTSANTFNHLDIAGSGTKTLGAAINTGGNLTINSGLDVSALNYAVNVGGNWVNNGTFTPQSGTVTFNGTTSQTIGGTTATNNFYNITQSNAAGVSLAQNQNLIGTLDIGAGTFTSTGYDFTLKSTSARTARIAEIPGSGGGGEPNFAGDIIMERYTGTGPIDWRFLSSSVSGATIAQWADNFKTSGFTGAFCAPTDCAVPGCGATCNWPSIYWYDETKKGNLDDSGFVAIDDVTNPIVPGRGYWVYIGPNPVTFEVKGNPNKFDQPFSVFYTESSPPNISDDGWNLITNSYPSAIDWDDPNWVKSPEIDDAVYIFNSFVGNYATYSGGFGLLGGSRYIGSQQAFYVKANAAGPSISKVETVKTASENPSYPFLKTANTPNTSLHPMAFRDFPVPLNTNNIPNSILFTASGNGYDDETIICFRQGATNGFDGKYDAWKLLNPNPAVPNISTVMNNSSDYSINNLPPLSSQVDIPIRLRVPVTGKYTIRRDSILMMPMSCCLILEDKITGALTDLRTVVSYSCTVSKTTTAPRFVLHIYPPISVAQISNLCYGDSNGIAVAKGTGAGPWNYTWKDAGGNILQTTSNSIAADSLFNLPAGIYTVYVSGSACGTVSDTITVNAPPDLSILASFTDVSCNGLSDGTASVSVSGGAEPYYYLWSNGNTTSGILALANGRYAVTVTDANGCTGEFSASVSAPVVADFEFNKDTLYLSLNDTAYFYNASSGSLFYQWDFGDASAVDSTLNPVHYYDFAGTYAVTLIASDGLCYDTVSYTLVVMDSLLTTYMPYISTSTSVTVIYENGEIVLAFDLPEKKDVRISVYNTLGEKILVQDVRQIQKNKIKLLIENLAPGVYVSVADMSDAVITRKIIIPGMMK